MPFLVKALLDNRELYAADGPSGWEKRSCSPGAESRGYCGLARIPVVYQRKRCAAG